MTSTELHPVFSTSFRSWQQSLPPLLEAADLAGLIPAGQTILIKPNLVENLEPPITTPVGLVEILVDYLQEKTGNPIIIGEGSGSVEYDTFLPFHELGYSELARRKGIELKDLAPPAHYREGNSWQKSAFHRNIQEAIADLNRYRRPDFTILDATIGMAEAHLWGRTCDPPVNILAAGRDPVAMDSYGAGLLSLDWQKIGHIAQVHRELGTADPLQVISLKAA